MSEASLLWVRDPHLRTLALSRLPAWAWSLDITRVIWANPAGAAILGAATPAALAARRFDAVHPAAAQIARLAAAGLPEDAGRFERLRGFGVGVSRALTCRCSRITLADGEGAILIAAAEPAGPNLSFAEQLHRLLTDCDEPIAAFAADGTLIHALPAARERLGGARTLKAIGAEMLAVEGAAAGHTAAGWATVDRIGSEPILLVTFGHVIGPGQTSTPEDMTPISAPCASDAATQAAEMNASPPPALAQTFPVPAGPVAAERRHPLRFVWQIDAEGHFTLDSEEFTALAGPQTATTLGRTWDDISVALDLDPNGQIARALATRDTWSGLTVAWPVNDGDERVAVELSGLPVFDRERSFRGYRGFGVCRALAGLSALARHAGGGRAGDVGTEIPAIAMAVPLDATCSEPPALTPNEGDVSQELAHRLSNRLTLPIDGACKDTTEVTEFDQDLFVETEPAIASEIGTILDRFPVGVLIYRLDDLLYANHAFLRWAGYETLVALREAGGLDALLIESGPAAFENGDEEPFALSSGRDDSTLCEGRLFVVPWEGESAFVLVTMPAAAPAVAASAAMEPSAPIPAPAPGVPVPEVTPPVPATAPTQEPSSHPPSGGEEVGELRTILDTATDGVIVLDRELRVASANRSAQALFGQDAATLSGQLLFDLLAPESVEAAVDYIEALRGSNGVLNAGREVIGRERQGGLIPLFMTIGRLSEHSGKLCVVLRDLTAWKKTANELIEAKRRAEKQSAAKSDFLAKVSHEIRNPLNAIIGFSEVMMEERFGPIGNDRYRQYLKDIRDSGGHIMSLVNDLLDLSKIEAGKLDLTFASVALNELLQQCVALMQPQANRGRVIIRTSLAPKLPLVLADARSLRQIVLNLLSNSIKFTGAGGQVIVSTARIDSGDVVLRVRDTGIGMSEKELATALEPFRQIATATRVAAGGTGLGLPLTKALAEANRARFRVDSRPNEGTLVEVTFPGEQVVET